MNQYERIVSYIYRYDKGQKGMNVGFARVERRGQQSRITIQLRASLAQKTHEGYLFWQQPEGIRTIPVGRLALRGGNFVLKADTDTEKLFGTEKALGQMEGIFIDVEKDVYYATTWKNDSFHLGDWREWQNGITDTSKAGTAEQAAGNSENTRDGAAAVGAGKAEDAEGQEADIVETDAESQEAAGAGNAKEQGEVVKNQGIIVGMAARSQQETVKNQDTVDNTAEGSQQETVNSQKAGAGMDAQDQSPEVERILVNTQAARDGQKIKAASGDTVNSWGMGNISHEKAASAPPAGQRMGDKEEAAGENSEQAQTDMQIQSICSTCPFKRKNYDYGKKILMTFPSMKPFPTGIARACVRMELQDIGCLPVASWQLAGNRFLLHGYYCYRHLLFAQLADGNYVLGVPGVFSDKERRNAARFGFDTFQAIGEPIATQGVFGYWLMDMQPAA